MPKAKAQIGMSDNWCKDPELEQILEERELARGGVAVFRKVDKEAKNKIAAITISKPYRCGRFIVAESVVPEHHVDFDISSVSRLSITLADE